MDEEIDVDHTDVPVCPHCGNRDEDWTDSCDLDRDGDTSVWECGQCEKQFDITMHVSYSFSTEKVTKKELRLREIKDELNHLRHVIPLMVEEEVVEDLKEKRKKLQKEWDELTNE